MEATQVGSQSGCGKVGVAHPSGILIAQWRTAFFRIHIQLKYQKNAKPQVAQVLPVSNPTTTTNT
jgi:ribosomal protein S8